MANRTKFTPALQDQFLADLVESCGNVSTAADKSNCSRTMWYELRKADEEFAARWDAAVEEGLQRGVVELETCLVERAKAGSDKLLIFALQTLRRQRYGNKVEVEGNLNVVIKNYGFDGKPVDNEDEEESE